MKVSSPAQANGQPRLNYSQVVTSMKGLIPNKGECRAPGVTATTVDDDTAKVKSSVGEHQPVIEKNTNINGQTVSSDALDDGFEMPRTQKRRLRRQNVVTGKKKSTATKSGTKFTEILVSRIHKDVTEGELNRYISEEDVKVESFTKVSHADARMQSFKVIIPSKYSNKVMDSEFWRMV